MILSVLEHRAVLPSPTLTCLMLHHIVLNRIKVALHDSTSQHNVTRLNRNLVDQKLPSQQKSQGELISIHLDIVAPLKNTGHLVLALSQKLVARHDAR